ncbi:MAG: histidine triad nucleotide-binding protein [Polyangiaceae bacterium]|nr:histidine triad nucleotide-binding protein [Polyangiaceae bacterium]
MCLFCKIVNREIKADVVRENEHALAFRDIHPAAPTHLLVIPKRHIAAIHDATAEDAALLGQLMLLARDVAEEVGLAENGYRLVVNNGRDAGQSVFHIHVHVLGGRALAWPPG